MLALLLLAAGTTLAHDVAEFKKCAAISRDADRLKCYDNAFENAPPQDSEASSDDLRDDPIIATVTRVSKKSRGEHVVELDNGSTWEQQFASSYFPVAVGDKVEVEKRRFSGYRLISESGKGYGVQRVK